MAEGNAAEIKRRFIWGSTAPFLPFSPADSVTTQSSFSRHLEKLNCCLQRCWLAAWTSVGVWLVARSEFEFAFARMSLILSFLSGLVMVCLFRHYKFRQCVVHLWPSTVVLLFCNISLRHFKKVLQLPRSPLRLGPFLVMQVHMKEVNAVQTANRLTAVYLIKDMMEVLTPVGKLGCCCSIK